MSQESYNKTITFLLFGPILCPGGGIKIILEYANRLAKDGHKVNVVYPATLNWKKKNLKYKLKSIYHYFLHEQKGWKCKRWFNLDPRVKEIHSISLNYKDIPKSDIYIATEARTAPYVAKYPVDKSHKFYFIQGFDNWNLSDEEVKATYRLPLTKIVIADWLRELVKEEKEECYVVKNSFDFDYFKLYNPIKGRNSLTIGTLYHEAVGKDVKTTMKALSIVHNKYPDLQVLMFGTANAPENLPKWYKYFQTPNQETHNWIYNNSAIFVGSSKQEGWGLTIGEAMICGAAVACTDIQGYREMAKHEETALLSSVGDPQKLAANIIRLIEDTDLREKLASNGNRFIQQFKWEKAYASFRQVLGLYGMNS